MLTIKGLKKNFGGLIALSNIDIHVNQNEILGVIGPNGAGKTTLFNIITGLVKPTDGNILLHGKDITGWQPHLTAKAGIARTFQNIRLFNEMTVFDNVLVSSCATQKFVLDISKLKGKNSDKTIINIVKDILDFSGIDKNLYNIKAGNLSYGDQRRLELARALAQNPDIILLDEPTAGMNAFETSSSIEAFRKVRDRGITVVLIEHDMKVVMELSDRIIVLNFGKLIAEGSPEVIKCNEDVIEAYLGKEGQNATDRQH